MAQGWIVHRLRSSFLRENMTLLVLRLLAEGDRGEWEVLSALDSRYGLTPTAKEFRKLCETLVGGGYATLERAGRSKALSITKGGAVLLRRLEEEYAAVLSGSGPSPGPLPR